MYSTFMGLETAYRALITAQTALNVSGQNISNASTKGYSRQIDNIQATAPLTVLKNGKAMSIGTGATIDSITRVRDAYIDHQYRREASSYEYWSGREASLNMVEGLLNETSQFSLSNDLAEFWNAWSELANNPEQSAGRIVVKEKALTLVETFNHINQQITDLQDDLNKSVDASITQINTIAEQIQVLNIQIKNSEVRGDNPNDIKDKRDALVDQLSELVPVTVVESRDDAFTDRQVGNYTVIIGNPADSDNVLVDNTFVKYLQEDPVPIDPANGFSQVVWQEDYDSGDGSFTGTVDLGTKRGSLQADLEMRDTYLITFRGQIDTLAAEMANAVNAIHKEGRGLENDAGSVLAGLDFFTSTDADPINAGNITVNSVIQNDENNIAAATDNTPDPVESGDASIALAIASLASGWEGFIKITAGPAPLAANSFGDYYEGIVAQMGSDVQQSTRMVEGQSVLVSQLNNSREALSGVSLDEEMIDLLKFQKGYSSAARLVTMLDSMLDSVLGMGVTR